MRRLHPATIVVAILPRLREAIRAALPVLAGSYFSGHKFDGDWVAALIAILTGVLSVGAYWTTRFDIEEGHVSRRSGWIFRKDRRIPLEQVQNVNLRQTFLERILGVATVDVETARGHGHEMKLSVLGWGEAQQFRDELLSAAHLNVTVTPEAPPPLVRLSRHDLLFGAITEAHFAPMFIFLFTFGGPMMGVAARYAQRLPLLAWVGVFCGGLFLTVIGSWAWGAASYVLKYGDFTVISQEHIFRISYGLLNKIQMAVRPNRIEFLQIKRTLPQRWLGRASFHVGTAASFGEAGVVAPVALYVPVEVAYRSAADVIPGLDLSTVSWQPFHPNFYGRAVGRSLILLAVFGLIARAASFDESMGMKVLIVSLFALAAAIVLWLLAALFLARPENGFAVTDDALVVRQGWFTQRIQAIPIWRMENAAITQPAWWKPRRAVQLAVQGMKHHVRVGAAPEDAVEDLLSRWRKKISERQVETPPDEARLTEDLEAVAPALD